MNVLVISNIAGHCDHLHAVLQRTSEEQVDAVLVLGNLATGGVRRESRRNYLYGPVPPLNVEYGMKPANSQNEQTLVCILAMLGDAEVPVYLIPGEADAPLADFYNTLVGINCTHNIHWVHRVGARLGTTALVAGFGGAISAGAYDANEGLHFHPWELRAAFERLQAFNPLFRTTERRIFMFATPPRGARVDLNDSGHTGLEAVNMVNRSYHPSLVVCGGAESGRGMEMIDGVWVVNPGSLTAGSYALIDLDTMEVRLARLPEPASTTTAVLKPSPSRSTAERASHSVPRRKTYEQYL